MKDLQDTQVLLENLGYQAPAFCSKETQDQLAPMAYQVFEEEGAYQDHLDFLSTKALEDLKVSKVLLV